MTRFIRFGTLTYRMCSEKGINPKDFADTLAGIDKLCEHDSIVYRSFLEKHHYDEPPSFDSMLEKLISFGAAAQKNKDMESYQHVCKLVENLRCREMIAGVDKIFDDHGMDTKNPDMRKLVIDVIDSVYTFSATFKLNPYVLKNVKNLYIEKGIEALNPD